MLEEPVRSVPVADLVALTAILHVASPLEARVGEVRLPTAPS